MHEIKLQQIKRHAQIYMTLLQLDREEEKGEKV